MPIVRQLFAFVSSGFLIVAFGTTAMSVEIPKFSEETKTAGINHKYEGGFAYMAGAGVAVFDCNDDDLPDLYFAGGEKMAGLFVNASKPAGSLKFNRTTGSGLELLSVIGAYPLDIDSDGKIDLAVLRQGENTLMKGLGNCQFSRANEEWNFDGGNGWTTAFSATWETGNSWPTLVFGNFMIPETVIMDYGDCDQHSLYRPRPSGRYSPPGFLNPGFCALSMLFSDWNRDGVPDLRISNDKEFYRRGGEEQLFRFNANSSPEAYSREQGWNGVNIWGMGIASHDISGDGYPDYYLTNMIDNRFEVLKAGAEKPEFVDQSRHYGIAAGYPFTGGDNKPSTAWHAEFGDVNNDGLADLLVVKGNVETVRMNADADPNNLLIQQQNGQFVEGAKAGGLLSFELGRSGALVDLNADGALDVVVTNRFANVETWRNTGVTGNWLQVNLESAGKNPNCIGCWLEVKTDHNIQRREITVGGGHAGGQTGSLHFGLGRNLTANLRIKRPGQNWSEWMPVGANRSVTIQH